MKLICILLLTTLTSFSQLATNKPSAKPLTISQQISRLESEESALKARRDKVTELMRERQKLQQRLTTNEEGYLKNLNQAILSKGREIAALKAKKLELEITRGVTTGSKPQPLQKRYGL